jgi:hypothetical protein
MNNDPGPQGLPAISDQSIPIKNPDALVREHAEEGGKHLVYVPDRESIFIINDSAKAILESCDGNSTVQQIVDRFEATYAAPTAMDINRAVRDNLEVLLALSLIALEV